MKRLLLSAIALSIVALSAMAGVGEWVDSVYNSLNRRERVAQLFIPHLVISDNETGRASIKRYVGKDKVGGILLGSGSVESYAALNGYAMSLAEIPLMITADAEWGLAMRLKDAPRFPRNLALGAGDDIDAMESYGREMARQCRLLGITVSFAPVVDVNTNPANPVIGNRSFGENPQRVAALAKAYARGLESGGVMAVAKHFPGHGDTSSDSHLTLPRVSKSIGELEMADLVPFAELINDGIGGVMVGHLDVPSLDRSSLPASLSAPVVTGLLKEKMGFDGLVFTDALEMKGARMPDGTNNCVAALEAGADILLGSLSPSSDIDAVVSAISSGRLSEGRIEQSVRKVLTHKYYLGLSERPEIQKHPVLSTPATKDILDRLSRMSVTLLLDDDGVLPVGGDKKIAVVGVGGRAETFLNRLKQIFGQNVAVADPKSELGSYDIVLAPVVSSKDNAVSVLASLHAKSGRRLVPVFFINAYQTGKFSRVIGKIPSVIIAGDNTTELQRASAEALAGQFKVSGRLPVSVAGVGNMGDGVDLGSADENPQDNVTSLTRMGNTIDSLIDAGLERGAFPGCQVMVLKDGVEVYNRSAGYTDSRRRDKVTPETLFDVASVSKLAGTLVGMMAAESMMRLDSRLSDYFDAGDAKGELTLRQLATHRTGLPPSINAYRFAMDTSSYDGPLFRSRPDDIYSIRVDRNLYGNRKAKLRGDLYSDIHDNRFKLRVADRIWASQSAADSIIDYIVRCVPLKKSKGYRYSCLNYILLGHAIECATGMPLDRWLEAEIYGPMGLGRICYSPLLNHDIHEIAATERDDMLRKSVVHGTVHDETAALAGGVSGNAGLFANASSLAAVGGMLLDDGVYRGQRILPPGVARKYVDGKIGFDSNGTRWIGHTGFTGTCMWLDPADGIVVVVLTNRVNPTRDNSAFKALNFRNAVLKAVDECYSESGVTP